MNKTEVLDAVNWKAALAAPRYAGGHEEVFRALFDGVAPVIAWASSDDYDGTVCAAYQFPDGSVAILGDGYGSCSGCDAWEDAGDEDARALIVSMVTSARLFPTLAEAQAWAKAPDEAIDYHFTEARKLWP